MKNNGKPTCSVCSHRIAEKTHFEKKKKLSQKQKKTRLYGTMVLQLSRMEGGANSVTA